MKSDTSLEGGQRPGSRLATPVVTGALVAGLLVSTLAFRPMAFACKGTPRTPCSKSVVLNVISPGTVIAAPAGGGVPDPAQRVRLATRFFAPTGHLSGADSAILHSTPAFARCDRRHGNRRGAGVGRLQRHPRVAHRQLPAVPASAPSMPAVRVTFNDGMVLEDTHHHPSRRGRSGADGLHHRRGAWNARQTRA